MLLENWLYYNSIITCSVSLSCQGMYLDVYKTLIFENVMMVVIVSFSVPLT